MFRIVISNCWEEHKNLSSSWCRSNRPIWRKKVVWVIDLNLGTSKKKKSRCWAIAEQSEKPFPVHQLRKKCLSTLQKPNLAQCSLKESGWRSLWSPEVAKCSSWAKETVNKPKSLPNHLKTDSMWGKKKVFRLVL